MNRWSVECVLPLSGSCSSETILATSAIKVRNLPGQGRAANVTTQYNEVRDPSARKKRSGSSDAKAVTVTTHGYAHR